MKWLALKTALLFLIHVTMMDPVGAMIHVPFHEAFFPYPESNFRTEKNGGLFQSLYDSYQNNFHCSDEYRIPSHIHFIWLGSPLPETCRRMVASWQKFHPGWTITIWTDEEAAFFELQNQAAFDRAKNYGEKSDILRYEILYRYGGLYVDIDFECLQPFDDIHRSCEFYTGVNRCNTCLLNGLIGARPGHPILQACIDHLSIGNGDHDAQRIMTDTGPYHFTKMFLASAPGQEKIVPFPPTFFYPFPAILRGTKSIECIKRDHVRAESMAIHYWASTWQKNRI